jgi:hypothetical protein
MSDHAPALQPYLYIESRRIAKDELYFTAVLFLLAATKEEALVKAQRLLARKVNRNPKLYHDFLRGHLVDIQILDKKDIQRRDHGTEDSSTWPDRKTRTNGQG